MTRDDMTCENCRFVYKIVGSTYETYCARHAPLFDSNLLTKPHNYFSYHGVPVYKLFACGDGQWLYNDNWISLENI